MGNRGTEGRQCAKVERDTDDIEFKESMKTREELPNQAAMLCNLKTFRHWEICSESDEIRKSKHACVVGAHESTRKRSVRTLPKDLEDHIAETVFNSLNHCNLGAHIHSCASSGEELRMQKQQWTKNGKSSNSCWPGK